MTSFQQDWDMKMAMLGTMKERNFGNVLGKRNVLGGEQLRAKDGLKASSLNEHKSWVGVLKRGLKAA
jgi:hypothetical protein